jgi:MIP family channel proteins
MVSATLHISGGQFNPAVSLALLATGKMPARDALMYVVTQLVAATLASFLLVALFGKDAVAAGTPAPGGGLSALEAMVMELVLTFILLFVIFGVAVDKRGPNVLAGLLIGLTVTLDILFGGPYTGASMNPARSFGPALASGKWVDHWVYWVGPLVGGVLAAVVYNSVFLKPAAPRTDSRA